MVATLGGYVYYGIKYAIVGGAFGFICYFSTINSYDPGILKSCTKDSNDAIAIVTNEKAKHYPVIVIPSSLETNIHHYVEGDFIDWEKYENETANDTVLPLEKAVLSSKKGELYQRYLEKKSVKPRIKKFSELSRKINYDDFSDGVETQHNIENKFSERIRIKEQPENYD